MHPFYDRPEFWFWFLVIFSALWNVTLVTLIYLDLKGKLFK